MNEARQIQNMIDFIEREAQERVEELDAAAQEEYDVEKIRLVEAEKKKVLASTEQGKKQVDIDHRVAHANFFKTQRLRVTEEQSKIVEQLRERTRQRIIAFVSNFEKYKKLLFNLIQQALLAVRTDAVVRTRKEDAAVVKEMIGDITQWYTGEMGSKMAVELSNDYLVGEDAYGGVIVTSRDGKITCNWTLFCRMKNCFNDQLPALCYYLFNPKASF